MTTYHTLLLTNSHTLKKDDPVLWDRPFWLSQCSVDSCHHHHNVILAISTTAHTAAS